MHSTLRVLLPGCLASMALAQAVVSPADRALFEGSSFTHLPLGRADARMQTLHLDVPGGTVITGHAYRREAAGVYGQVVGFQCDMQVTLSMAPHQPDQASTAFAQNVGPNPVVVLPRQLIGLVPTTRPTRDPAPGFDLLVPYATPFTVPAAGGTLCVDVEVFGNVTPSGNDRNFNVYLDAHQLYANGDSEQPGFRYGAGCAPAAGGAATYGWFSLWHRGTALDLELSLRNGCADAGNALTRVWVALGLQQQLAVWPPRPQCPLYSSNDVWFVLPGSTDGHGDYDGALAGLPLLPGGYRLWCQTGSVDLGNGDYSFGDGVTLTTPMPGPLPIPSCRVANSNDHTALTGALSFAVPVMEFF